MTAPVDQVPAVVSDLVNVVIDGVPVAVAQGTLIIRAAEQVGIEIPRFCDHPALEPVSACRQCLVEVASPGPDGALRPFPKPQPSCSMPVTEGMVVHTQNTSEVADRAQKGVLELLLINHPLDCPVCDKGGECPLQNQALTHGRPESRFMDVKRTFEKPLALSTEILLDRERCVMCQRCTRFSKEIAGDAFIDLQNRGAMQQIGTFNEDVLRFDGNAPAGLAAEDESGRPFSSYFSGNTIQICPVGALTSASYRFRARPFDLVSSPSVSEHDSSCSAIRIDHRRGQVLRRLADYDASVNEDWISDKDRFGFAWPNIGRISRPLVRKDGVLVETSWPDALAAAAEGLKAAIEGKRAKGAAVLPGGRVTMEDAYAYGKFARLALHTNDVDARARVESDEEQAFLGSHVAGTGVGVTFADLEIAPTVLLVGFEPEDEGGIVFLRLNKSLGKQRVIALAPFASRGLEKLAARLILTAPGAEAFALNALSEDDAAALRAPGSIIILGERLAGAKGAFSAAVALSAATGARLVWIPRRAGERGALEAGALPGLLPGGRDASKPKARADVAKAWGVADIPAAPGRSTAAILTAAKRGELSALVVGGVDPTDLGPDALAALKAVSFVVSLEVRHSAVTAVADVVFPVAPPVEKSGTFVNWEGRLRPFTAALRGESVSDHRVLDMLARELGVTLGTPTAEAAAAELAAILPAGTLRPAAPKVALPPASYAAPALPAGKGGKVVLASWHLLVDEASLLEGEPYLAGTARTPIARLSRATADAIGIADGHVTLGTGPAAMSLPAIVTAEMVDGVVWVPAKSPGSHAAQQLGARPGDLVAVKGGL